MQENRFWCSACHINCLFWRFFRKVVSFSCSTKPVCMHLERLYNSNRTSKFRSSIFMYAAFGYAHYLERKGKGYFGGYSNNIEYGLYVNYGHRIVRNDITIGYSPGFFFLEAGVQQMQEQYRRIFEQKLKAIKEKRGL